jgi:5-methylcytosine-specific restriction endonuclease McrA
MTPEERRERRRETLRKYNAKVRDKKLAWKHMALFGAVITKDRCAMCGTTDGGKKGLVVHHKDGNNGRRGLPLNNEPGNLVVLCRRCHPKVHTRYGVKEIESIGL